MKEKVTAIIVAAGSGKRMGSDIPKQFMIVNGRPVLYYTLCAFEESSVDDICIVTSSEYIPYVQNKIVMKYGFQKVSHVVLGGKERSDSVYQGLLADISSYVLVHDGARPYIHSDLINHVIEEVKEKKAVVLGVPVKDTIKIVDSTGCVEDTPNRNSLWAIQTPQAFEYQLIKSSYEYVMEYNIPVTDDSMAVECASENEIYICHGDYMNIKITTPEDLYFAEQLLK